MEPNGIITLTTDFGTQDPYAGIMKGVILSVNPNARIVDISHEIPAHDITNTAFTLLRAYRFFPHGTIHVVVVDPKVGGRRKNIAVRTNNYLFVGPDNGLFTFVFKKEPPQEIREIINPPFILSTISHTFHGRDVLAPCAGHLSRGENFSDIGPQLKNLQQLRYPSVTRENNVLRGEVVMIDFFGNMITNISEHIFFSFAGKQNVEISFANERFTQISKRYLDVPAGSPLVLFGSSGFMEISINEGSASNYFMTPLGSPVSVRRL